MKNELFSGEYLIYLTISCLVLLLVARTLSNLLSRIGLPIVVSEVLAGVLLGPTLLMTLRPEMYKSIFEAFPEQPIFLSFVYLCGLACVMVSSGLQTSIDLRVKHENRRILGLVLGATIAPFLFGYYIIDFSLFKEYESSIELRIFLACSAAVTSIPVLSRIFQDLRISRSKLAGRVLFAAALQDIFLWAILASTITAKSESVQESGMYAIINSLFKLVFLIVVLWFISSKCSSNSLQRLRVLKNVSLKVTIAAYFSVAIFAIHLAQLNFALGLFISASIWATFGISTKWTNSIGDKLLVSSLISIYFVSVGLSIDLRNEFDVLQFTFILVVTSIIKIASVFLSVRGFEVGTTQRVCYGVAMNARGGPGIALATIGLSSGIIDARLYTSLVMVSLITSLAAGLYLRKKREFVV